MVFNRLKILFRLCIIALVVTFITACGGGGTTMAPPPAPRASFAPLSLARVTLVSTDPFANTSSQHATEVEPSMTSFGSQIVATFQVGRFFNAGSSDIGFATSTNGGATWLSQFLPGTTHYSTPPGIFDSVSDPVVAFDAAHSVWLIASLPVLFTSGAPAPAALVSRSSDGLHWSSPMLVAPGQTGSDKEWIVCDNSLSSPYRGHCYLQWDDPSNGGVIHMNTSSDGGVTWGSTVNVSGNPAGIAGQPMVQPNGTVIVPIDDYFEANIIAFSSHDGGATWSSAVTVAPIITHFVAGNLRSGPLPSAAMDAAGTAYVVWQDCRFRAGCRANDLVLSTSSDGIHWSSPSRIPIDPTTSADDHFIPGLNIAPGTSANSAHIGLTYYFYPTTNCGSVCPLSVAYVDSHDGGASWSSPVALVGPMPTVWLPATDQGVMVGDYIATTFVGSQPVGIFAVADGQPLPGAFNEAMYVSKFGILPSRAAGRVSSYGERSVPGARSDRIYRLRPP